VNLKANETRTIVIGRDEVEACATEFALDVLGRLLSTPEVSRDYCLRVDVAFDGFNHVRDELFEIPSVREYVHQLDTKFPFWLYFLSRRHNGLGCIGRCFLLPFLTEKAQAELHPRQLAELIENRWGPALYHICSVCGHSESEADELLLSAMHYFQFGRERG
jgi:hypothetical protein